MSLDIRGQHVCVLYHSFGRLIEEKRIDNLTRRFSYSIGGHLTRVDETGYDERPRRHTEFERDPIGRMLAKLNDDASQDYSYDEGDRLLSIERFPTAKSSGLLKKNSNLPTTYSVA